jgi:6-pyruvoyltetrahydropterin/6-carboxytetrahydropterin synthase
MFELSIEDSFSAAHRLRDYQGKCENLHGHNWKVQVTVLGENLEKNGLLVDFGVLRKKLKQVLDILDHTNLNSVAFFKKKNPTSENISVFIYQKLIPEFKTESFEIKKVTVWENERQSASYIPAGEDQND